MQAAGEVHPVGGCVPTYTCLRRMACLVQVVAAKRKVIISLVDEIEEARKEEAWLRSYEDDEQRYKVGAAKGSLCHCWLM